MSAIVIGVRVRPFNQRELKFNSTNIVGMPTNKPGAVALKIVRQGKILNETPKEFNFDHAFWTHDGEGEAAVPRGNVWADQKAVFEILGMPVLKNIIDGYNATLFAYGQTGSGKTYTMMGYPPNDVGIIPRMCDELFASLAELGTDADDFQLNIECSYLEIYNEEVHDLLAKERSEHGLKVRQHPKTGVFVEGLKKVIVSQANDVLTVLSEGNTARTVAATNMNASSSRSHAVVTLTVSLTMTKGGVIQGKYAKLVLVDLAGSERAASTGARGDTLVEGANINKSLSTLGMVLSRLADQADAGKSLPVPFRDSSLTFLLHDSFGGNSRTAMIANISPADVCYEETLSTLRFAQVTKRVKNKAVINENPAARLIRELTEELAGLKGRLTSLKVERTKALTSAEESAQNEEDEAALAQLIEMSEAAQDSLVLTTETAGAHGASAIGQHDTVTKEDAEHGVIFVEWSKPQLINLCPESRMLIMTVTAGDAFVSIDDPTNPASRIVLEPARNEGRSILRLNYSPLRNVLTAEGLSESGAILYINGNEISAHSPTVLEHGDRLAIGSLIFRVSHTTNIPIATPYSKIYTCQEHINLAEEYHRQFVMHQWAAKLSEIARYASDAPVELESQSSPIAVNPSDTGDCSGLEIELQSDMRQRETDLVSQYPVSNAELAAYAKEYQKITAHRKQSHSSTELAATAGTEESFDAMLAPTYDKDPTAEQLHLWASEGKEEYLQAKREQEEALDAKQRMIAELKNELEALANENNAPDGHVAEEAGVPAAECASTAEAAEVESEAMEKAFQREFMWHQDVKQLRTYRRNGPLDEKESAVWRVYSSGSKGKFPFLSQLHAEQEKYYEENFEPNMASVASAGQLSATDNGNSSPSKTQTAPFVERYGRRGTFYKMKQSKDKWDLRYYIIVDSFMYYFYSPHGTMRCLGALYLRGSTITYLGAHGGKQHVVLVKLAAPRRADEPKENSFYFAFSKQRDAALWCHWMAVAASPIMPTTMTARLVMEAMKQFDAAGVKLETHPQFYPVNPLLLGLTDLVPTTEGDASQGAWKNDETVADCERCKGAFTFFNRRHHCRTCGGIYCGNCAPKFGKDNERTCQSCQTELGKSVSGEQSVEEPILEAPPAGEPVTTEDKDGTK